MSTRARVRARWERWVREDAEASVERALESPQTAAWLCHDAGAMLAQGWADQALQGLHARAAGPERAQDTLWWEGRVQNALGAGARTLRASVRAALARNGNEARIETRRRAIPLIVDTTTERRWAAAQWESLGLRRLEKLGDIADARWRALERAPAWLIHAMLAHTEGALEDLAHAQPSTQWAAQIARAKAAQHAVEGGRGNAVAIERTLRGWRESGPPPLVAVWACALHGHRIEGDGEWAAAVRTEQIGCQGGRAAPAHLANAQGWAREIRA